jgi:hypothetical protein
MQEPGGGRLRAGGRLVLFQLGRESGVDADASFHVRERLPERATLTGENRSTPDSDDVEEGSLTPEDFKRGQVPQGPAGERGPTGPAGPQGPLGRPPGPETPKTVPSFPNGWARYDEDVDGSADGPVRYWKISRASYT